MLVAQGCCAMCRGDSDYRSHRDDYIIAATKTRTRKTTPNIDMPILQRTTSKSFERHYSASPRLSISPEGLQFNMNIQSSVQNLIDSNIKEANAEEQEQNVGFSDETPGIKVDIPAIPDYVNFDTSQNVELGNFLQRPVLISTLTWTQGSSLSTIVTPWSDYFDNPVVKRKLDNYYMLRCNLHVKFVINASPFYYGAVCCAYNPLPDFATTAPNATFPINTLSQRPCVWLYPQNCDGGEMVLPFLYHKAWLNATVRNDLIRMGTIDIESATVLLNANSTALQDVNIQIYAWTSELELAGPTTALSVQSKKKNFGKDEYQYDGVISKPASAIARYTGQLSQVPWLAPYATATSMISSAVADVASIFGYTRVPNISEVDYYRPNPLPHFASTDIGEPIEKITLDAKNELSIDSKICGVDMQDELNISSMVTREALLTSFDWSSTDINGDSLFNSQVQPHLCRSVAGTGETTVIFTPMAYVSNMFSYWRGDIVFRLKFLCTKFHKGRVQVTWDPKQANWGLPLDETTSAVYTKIVDLATDTDVEFQIPYTQPTPYLKTRNAGLPGNLFGSTGSVGTSVNSNGNFLVSVLTQQTSPVASADIKVLVFVKGADNLEFAAPQSIIDRYSPYEVQSEVREFEYDASSTKHHHMGIYPSKADGQLNLVHMGETIPSLRSCIQRTSRYIAIVGDLRTTTNSYQVVTAILNRLPLYPGFDTNGIHEAAGINTPSDFPYNFVSWSPMSWLSLCFVAQRGSIDYYIRPINNKSRVHASIERYKSLSSPGISTSELIPNPYNMAREFSVERSGFNGMSVTQASVNECLSASLPLYSVYKFMNNNPLLRTTGTSLDDSIEDKIEIQLRSIGSQIEGGAESATAADVYIKAGADFSFVFFRNAPVLKLYSSQPAAGTYP